MRTIGNILWIIFATLAFWPFGKEIVYGEENARECIPQE